MNRDRLVSRQQMEDRLHEQRRSQRISIMVPVVIFPIDSAGKESEDGVPGVTVNISAGGLLQEQSEEYGSGGLLIEVDKELPVDSRCRMSLTLPLPGFVGDFEIEGHILRYLPPEDRLDKHKVAVKFTKILTHSFNNVKLDLVRKLLSDKP